MFDKRVRAFMIMNDKYDASGKLVKFKGRLVCNGKQQPKSTYDPNQSSSPTLNKRSMMVIANIAAFKDLHVCTMDISSAFVHADIDKEVYIKVDADVAKLLIQINPKYRDFLEKDDGLTLRLNRALYGLIQSPVLWYFHFTKVLKSLGYKQLVSDKCVFVRNSTIIGLHVDDLLIATDSQEELHRLENKLRSSFLNVTVNHSVDSFEYLGVFFRRDRVARSIEVCQSGKIERIIEDLNIRGDAATPCINGLFEVGSSEESKKQDVDREFLSKLMKLNYLATSRQDILTTLSFLSSRSHYSTPDDHKKLNRLLDYVKSTKDVCLKICPSSLQLVAYADAAWGVNESDQMKSQTGCVISFGPIEDRHNGMIISSSKKQNDMIAKSSTEAELYALDSTVDEICWLLELVEELGIKQERPVKVFQDNQSTMKLIMKEGTYGRTKHIKIRYFAVKNRVKVNDVKLCYLPSEEMLADILTKGVTGANFKKLRSLLLGEKVRFQRKTSL